MFMKTASRAVVDSTLFYLLETHPFVVFWYSIMCHLRWLFCFGVNYMCAIPGGHPGCLAHHQQ